MHSLGIEPVTWALFARFGKELCARCESQQSVSDTVLNCSVSVRLHCSAAGRIGGFKVSLVSREVNYTPAAPGCSSPAVPLLLFSSSDGTSGADAFGKLAGNVFALEFLTQTVGLLLLMAI